MQMQFITSLALTIVVYISGVENNCASYANRIYQLREKITGIDPFYGVFTLLPNGIFHARESVARSVQGNLFSDITGYYHCPNARTVHLVGTADYYPDPTVSYLNKTGALGLFEHKLRFTANRKECTGRSLLTFYRSGSDPMTADNEPVHVGGYADVTCRYLERPTDV